MKWLRLLTILIIVIIVTSITSTVTLSNVYSAYKGNVESTGFVIKEFDGSGGVKFDVDDDGKLYFAVDDATEKAITIYDKKGIYLYSLQIHSGGEIGVKIDDDNNILVCYARKESIDIYNNQGIYIKTISDIGYLQEKEFFPYYNENKRERNGIVYINSKGTITKIENGIETVVFTIPTWQKWHRAASTIMVLSIVALFLRIAIPLWIKAYKERNGR